MSGLPAAAVSFALPFCDWAAGSSDDCVGDDGFSDEDASCAAGAIGSDEACASAFVSLSVCACSTATASCAGSPPAAGAGAELAALDSVSAIVAAEPSRVSCIADDRTPDTNAIEVWRRRIIVGEKV